MSVARFIADQRTLHRVPHTTVCALLGVSPAWFYKWMHRADGPDAASGLHTGADRRRAAVAHGVTSYSVVEMSAPPRLGAMAGLPRGLVNTKTSSCAHQDGVALRASSVASPASVTSGCEADPEGDPPIQA